MGENVRNGLNGMDINGIKRAKQPFKRSSRQTPGKSS
jgi:hypothetical protein